MVHPRSTFWSRRLPKFVAWGGVLLLVLFSASAVGGHFLDAGSALPPSAPAAVPVDGSPGRSPAVDAPAGSRLPIPSGEVEAARRATLRAAVGGRVTDHCLAVGRAVDAGQVLVELDDADLGYRIEGLELARQRLVVERESNAIAGRRLDLQGRAIDVRRQDLETQRRRLDVQIERAMIALGERERELRRDLQILERNPGALRRDVVDQEKAARDMANKDLESLRVEGTMLDQKIEATAIDRALVDEERAALAQELALVENRDRVLESDLRQAHRDRADYRIAAPFAGAVAHRMVEIGEEVQPGQSLVELVDTSRLRVEFHLPARWRIRLAPGDPLELASDLHPDRTFAGRVVEVAPTADDRTHQFRIVLEIDPGEDAARLWPGMIVRVLLDRIALRSADE